MNILVNLIAHDGIASHYTGVGTMVGRYIDAILGWKNNRFGKITLNLITPVYKPSSFAYNKRIISYNKRLIERTGGKIYFVDNGSEGEVNYGDLKNWQRASRSAATLIRKLNTSGYDLVINLANDTPFANVFRYLNIDKFINFWIPHSTALIHKVNSALDENTPDYISKRYKWEKSALHYLPGNPELSVMTRWMYPNPKLGGNDAGN